MLENLKQDGVINVGEAQTRVFLSWTNFKKYLNGTFKSLALQYVEFSAGFTVFCLDESIVYVTEFAKVPADFPDVFTTQQEIDDHNADRTDFVNNWQIFGNKPIAKPIRVIVDGYVTTTNNSFTRIDATLYTEQTTNAQRSIVSSSASDTSAGTGARTVRVTYYDQTLAGPFVEDITLNGTTAVNTVASNICFIERIEVLTVGSAGGNVGTIQLKTTTGGGGSTFASIAAGDNETNWCHHYIATGKVCKVSELIVGIKGTSDEGMSLRRSKPTVANTPELTIYPTVRVTAGDQDQYPLSIPVIVAGPAKILLYAKADATGGNNDWLAGFSFYEE